MEEIRTILPSVIKGFKNPVKEKRSLLVTQWANIAGEKLAKRTQPQLSSQGVLYVRVDESVIAFEVSQKYKQALLKRAQAVLGEETVKEIRVLVGKTSWNDR